MGVGGHRHAPAAFPPGKIRYPLYRRLGGPQSRSGRMRKRSPPPAFDPWTFQPVASRCTNWAIPAHIPITGTRRVSVVFNWMEGERAPDAVRMRWRRAESLPKSGMELPPAIPQSNNHCTDRQLARQGGILYSVTRNWEDAMLRSVVRLSCGETEYFAWFNLPTTGSPTVLSHFTGEIGQIYNNAETPQSGGSCPSSPFTTVINRSRINAAGIGRRNSPYSYSTLSSPIRFKFWLSRSKQGTIAEVNLSSPSLPYLDVPSTSKQANIHGPKILRNKNICSSIQWFIRNMFLIT
jgi:hypothetical protein